MDWSQDVREIQESGIRFTLRLHLGRYVVRLGNYREQPDAEAVLPTIEEAVGWLREQVKILYPESAYA